MRNNLINKGFSLVEMIIVVGIISTISGLTLPTFLNWVRSEKVNSYTRELKEYLRVVRLEARRWGTSCDIKINEIDLKKSNLNLIWNDNNLFIYKVKDALPYFYIPKYFTKITIRS